MKLSSIHLSYIRSYREQTFNPRKTRVIVGQNDQGKSSLLKVMDLVFNEISAEHVKEGYLPARIADKILPSFPVGNRARRITLNFENSQGKPGQIFITFRQDYSFDIRLDTARGGTTTPQAIKSFHELQDRTKFILIPAVRDARSDSFYKLLSNTLDKYGIRNLIPKEAGGTTREYRALKDISKKIKEVVAPFIANELAPKIKETLGIQTEDALSVSFSADPKVISDWIKQNLQLSVTPTSEDASEVGDPVPLTETGSGIQSAVLLALHRLELTAAEQPEKEFFFAIEEPEAFLHPQKQKELFENIKKIQGKNLTVLATTHSPYVLAATPFEEIGVVKKVNGISKLIVPEILSESERQKFSFYSNEVNSQLFFAEKLIFVEGESDRLVIREILRKKFPDSHHSWTIVQAAGNRNFSPYIRMALSIKEAKLPFVVVTDFDSLTRETDRAIVRGFRDAGIKVPERKIAEIVDQVLDKGEKEYREVTKEVQAIFKAQGVNLIILPSDLEYSLVTPTNKNAVAKILSEASGADYSTGYDLSAIRRIIGSKGIPVQENNSAKQKKPYIHQLIARDAISIDSASEELRDLLDTINAI